MFRYPLKLRCKVLAVAPQMRVFDDSEQLLFYVREKILALKDDIRVFADEDQQRLLYRVKADRVIDLSAEYRVTDAEEATLGSLKRRGLRSFWRLRYDLKDPDGRAFGCLREENPWIKVLDGIASNIPLVSLWINPAYLIEINDQPVLRIKKQAAIFEGRFQIDRLADLDERIEPLLIIAALVMVMEDRRRG